MANRVVLIAPLSSPYKRTRLAKMVRFFREQEVAVTFLGWERIAGEASKLRLDGSEVVERTILRGGGYANASARALYPLWMLNVFIRVLCMERGSLCWCLGWETAFPARLAAYVSGCKIVFDDADRFSLLFKLPPLVERLVVRLERWASAKCVRHIVPGWSRYDWRNERMYLLRNTPMLADYSLATSTPQVAATGELIVYVNGWIAWDTGARVVLRTLDLLKEKGRSCRLLLAGRIASDAAEKLVRHPWTDYRGELVQAEALKLYRQAHVTLTLYDPSVPINRHAESNKWGDCVFLGTPFVVNSEVETAQKFVRAGAAFEFPYESFAALADILLDIQQNPTVLEDKKLALRKFENEYKPFDKQFSDLFAGLSGEVESGRHGGPESCGER